eukprot:CAMPEP_0114443900 /NCGR_PEP_ID=MMETSP0103-20121206/17780_1 /TAXON_ID=37642 ORGANISM="Paraphysomonas imperforata, Strain PA2" /NCGR_SAMPLE_ID=MMETSP0103 /ASSEMBLY_ACC=CAM_ASM_000201 /LENGTH=85 /DNA_ID=CAMNT_0001615363 /DNA_START=104 /DNA_END=358 /DNA_ORIENTATION=+
MVLYLEVDPDRTLAQPIARPCLRVLSSELRDTAANRTLSTALFTTPSCSRLKAQALQYLQRANGDWRMRPRPTQYGRATSSSAKQ